MPRRLQFCMIAIVALACGSATCLYSGAGPMDPHTTAVGGGWHPALAFVADLLTVAIPTEGIADIRDAALVFYLGTLLVVVVIWSWMKIAGEGPPGQNIASPTDQNVEFARNPKSEIQHSTPSTSQPAAITRYTFCLSASVIVLSLASALFNGALDLAWGWIARFTVGAGWAYVIARHFSPAMVRATLLAMFAIGALAVALAFAHRADRGYLYLSWPIGPITLTAALASCWAAMTLALMAATIFFRGRTEAAMIHPAGVMAVALPAAIAALAALHNTGRRAAAVGLIAALAVVAAVAALRCYPRRGTRVAVAAILLIGIAAGGIYVAREAASPDRIRSGPVQLRLTYLEQSIGLLRERPLLGVGPDQFVIAMTNRMAPLRAVSPQVYHGNLDNAAHNEWLQAAVELGLPGGALYFALPMLIIAITLRRLLSNTPARADAACTLALLAGLVAICVIEIAGVTMRGPIVPTWYWTILGLLAAQCRENGTVVSSGIAARSRGAARPLLASGLAAICFLICFIDLHGATRPILAGRETRLAPAPRLYAEKVIADQYAVAESVLLRWRGSPSKEFLNSAIDEWRRLSELLPSLLDTPARYAECLVLAGRNDEARAVLDRALRETHPYDVPVNVLYASLTDDPVERLRCVQRALRSGELGDALQKILQGALDNPTASELVAGGTLAARAAAGGLVEDAVLRDATVELLRIAAFDAARRGSYAEAIADQKLIAECYRRMEAASHAYRRPHDAEADAWLTLSRLIYEHDRRRWRDAYVAIRVAERYTIMGIRHESISDPRPDAGYLGGQVVPTEFPQRLYPLWRRSALLHLIAGEDRFLDLRILAGLPPSQWTPRDLNEQLARLARQAHADLSEIPPDARPEHYERLPDMARHYESQAAAP